MGAVGGGRHQLAHHDAKRELHRRPAPVGAGEAHDWIWGQRPPDGWVAEGSGVAAKWVVQGGETTVAIYCSNLIVPLWKKMFYA
jgi:hypothetical protein